VDHIGGCLVRYASFNNEFLPSRMKSSFDIWPYKSFTDPQDHAKEKG